MSPSSITRLSLPGFSCRGRWLIFFVAAAGCLPSLHAQDALANAALQQSQNQAQPAVAAAAVNGDGMALPQDASEADKQADADLGEQWVLKRNPRSLPFSVFADVSIFRTSNVALASVNEQADSFLVGSIGASYVRPLPGSLTLNLSVGETLFRYDRFDEFDFDSFNAGAALSLPVPRLWNANLSLQYSFSRLSRDIVSGELYSGHSFTLAATKTVQCSSADSFSFGATGAFNIADPSSLMRGDASLFLAYNLNLTRKVAFSASYRTSFFGYTNTDRCDLNQTLAAGLRFNPTEWFSLDATFSAVFNNSNRPAFDYSVFNGGGGVTAIVRF